jgi:hypothetical protein
MVTVRSRKTLLFVVATVAAILAVAGWSGLRPKGPSGPGKTPQNVVSHTSTQNPQDVIRYWTPERMRDAKGA